MNNGHAGIAPDFMYKPDWEKASARWDAYWEMKNTDRPCISIMAPRAGGKAVEFPETKTPEDFYEPEYVLAATQKFLEDNWLGGEAVPVSVGAGPSLGHAIGIPEDNVVLSEGCVNVMPTMDSIDRPLGYLSGPSDPWRPRVEAVLNRLLDDAPGRYIARSISGFGHVDLLCLLRGPSGFLLDLVMFPDKCRARLMELRELTRENFEYYGKLVFNRQGDTGCTSWTGVWCRRHFECLQADFAANISPAMFKEIVLPELDFLGESRERVWFHTCGYKQHLELYLERPYMRVVQYSPGPNEPGGMEELLDFYRRVQEAGRGLDISVSGREDFEFLVRRLRPEGLHIKTAAESTAEAEELLDKAAGWSGSDIRS